MTDVQRQGDSGEAKCVYCCATIDSNARVCGSCRLAQHKGWWGKLLSWPIFLDHRVSLVGLILAGFTLYYATVKASEASSARVQAEEARDRADSAKARAEEALEATKNVKREVEQLLNAERERINQLSKTSEGVQKDKDARAELDRLFGLVTQQHSLRAYRMLEAIQKDESRPAEIRYAAEAKLPILRPLFLLPGLRSSAPHPTSSKLPANITPCQALLRLKDPDAEIRFEAIHRLERSGREWLTSALAAFRDEDDLRIRDFVGWFMHLDYGSVIAVGRTGPDASLTINVDPRRFEAAMGEHAKKRMCPGQ